MEFPQLGAETGTYQYNNAIPLLMEKYLPTGVLGIAVTGLLAAFMAGMAANVSAFNTVFTYDIWQAYIKKDRPDGYYLRVGRTVTVVGVVIGIGTAFIASGYSNIMNYIQALFSIFNAPLFATFIIGMFWKRTTSPAAFWGLLAGTASAAFIFVTSESGVDSFGFDEPLLFTFGSGLSASFWGAVVAFVADALVTVTVSLVTTPKPVEQLAGLVYGSAVRDAESHAEHQVWWQNPVTFGIGALVLAAVLYIPFL